MGSLGQMQWLPEDLLQLCLGRLSAPDRAIARCVCRGLRHALSVEASFALRDQVGFTQPWLCVIGGVQVDSHGLLAEMFDFSAQKWRPMPASPPSSFFNFSCAVVGCNLYTVGGFAGLSNKAPKMPVYNLKTSVWTEVSQMTELREACACGMINGCIYVAGGYCRQGTKEQRLSSAEAYFPEKDEWHPIASMAEARSCCASAVVDNKIYVIGGYGRENILHSVEVYDPAEDNWSKKSSMPQVWILSGCASIESKIYVVGSNILSMDGVELAVYDTKLDEWNLVGSIPFNKLVTGTKCSLWGCAVTAAQGKLYVVGGSSSYDGGGLNTVLAYDPSKNEWATMRQMRERRHGCAAVMIHL